MLNRVSLKKVRASTNRVVIQRLDSDDLNQMRREYPFVVRECPVCGKCFELDDLIVRIETYGVVHRYHETCFKSPTPSARAMVTSDISEAVRPTLFKLSSPTLSRHTFLP